MPPLMDTDWLRITLPRLALDLIERGLDAVAPSETPRVVIDGPEQRATVHLADAAAQALGVRSGQRLVAAQALAPALLLHRRDRRAERQALELLAAWAYRYTSRVCLEEDNGLLLELRGSESLFGGSESLLAALREDLRSLGYEAVLGLGATPEAARVRARVARRERARSGQVFPLARIALEDSGLDGATIAALAATGIRTLGELARLPRAGLARRFGQKVLDYLGRLRGEVPEVLAAWQPPDSHHAWLELPIPCASQEALVFPIRRLLADLCAVLRARDGGVQHLTLRFALESLHGEGRAISGELCRLEIGLVEPSRELEHLLSLVRARMESMRFPRPVLGLHLEVAHLPRFVPRHPDLFGGNGDAGGWSSVVDRLTARLGESALLRPHWVADHRPEYASRWRPAAAGPALLRPPEGAPPATARPLWLLPRPLEVPGDAFLPISSGERIESGWWDDADVRRDYYVAELLDPAALPRTALGWEELVRGDGTRGCAPPSRFQPTRGARAWIYQDLRQPGRWFLHGWFG